MKRSSGRDHLEHPLFEGCGSLVVGRDHQDRVVSGNGADNLLQLFSIDSDGEGVGVSGRCAKNDQILGHPNIQQVLICDSRQIGTASFGLKLPIALGCFHEAEFANVARQSDLRGLNANLAQLSCQFVLRVDFLIADYVQNLALAKALVHVSVNPERQCRETLVCFVESARYCSRPGPPRQFTCLHAFGWH
jgi:hypothetical protein